MIAILIPVSALLLSVSMLLMGNGLQTVLLPVRALAEYYSAFAVSVMGSAYFVGFVGGCYLGPRMIRRVGHIRTFAVMVAVASALPLVHGMFTPELVWWLARAGTGVCLSVLYMVIESWLNEKSTNETRGVVFSVYIVINLGVVTLGQMLMTIGDTSTLYLFALASVLVSVSTVPVALTTASAPTPPALVQVRLGHLYEISPVGVIGSFGVGVVNGIFWSLAPVYAQSGTSNDNQVAVFMSIAVLAGALGQWPIGLVSDRTDRRRVILAVCAASALAGLGMILSPEIGAWAIIGSIAAFGFFALPLYAVCAAHLNDHVEDPDGFVEASSGLLLIFASGAIVGPLFASGVMEFMGVRGIFAATMAAHVLVATYTVWRMTHSPAVAEEDRAAFAETIVMAQAVTEVDVTETEEETDEAEEPEPEEVEELEALEDIPPEQN